MFSFQGQSLVLDWCFLCFLDETVEQNDSLTPNAKQATRNPRGKPGTQFPKAVPQAAHQRHPKRLAELECLEVFTDHAPLVCGQFS